MGLASLLRSVLCVQDTVIGYVGWEGEDLIVDVRSRPRDRNRPSGHETGLHHRAHMFE